MGTYYSINIVDLPENISRQDLQFEITKTLDEVNKKLSNSSLINTHNFHYLIKSLT